MANVSVSVSVRIVEMFRTRAKWSGQEITNESAIVLSRLEKDHVTGTSSDQRGKVSAAFSRLIPSDILHNPALWHEVWKESVTTVPRSNASVVIPPHPLSLLNSIIYSVHLAEHGARLPAKLAEAAQDFKRFSSNATELTKIIGESLPKALPPSYDPESQNRKLTLTMTRLNNDLPVIAEFFNEMVDLAVATQDRLFVTNKRNGIAAAQIRALRFVASNAPIRPGQKVGMYREAVKWLVEGALDEMIPQARADEAFRKRRDGD